MSNDGEEAGGRGTLVSQWGVRVVVGFSKGMVNKGMGEQEY